MYAKRGDPDQTPLSVVSGLGLYCFSMTQKRTLDLYGFIFHNIKISQVQEREN